MTPMLILTVAVLVPADLPSRSFSEHPPNPFAPSLPQLTDAEEDQLDRVIDRFIDFDAGRLPGSEGKQALMDFQQLGPEATFALIRGLNRAAHIDNSCPAVVIAKKLAHILQTSNDPELLDFARENIGLGVTHSRHMGVLKDLRVMCILRKGEVAHSTVALRAVPNQPSLRVLSTSELAQAAWSDHGPRLRQVLTELAKRDGDEAINTLGLVASGSEPGVRLLARDLLAQNLLRQEPEVVRRKLQDDRPEIRAAAARVAGARGLRFGVELIDRLTDEEVNVRLAAHQALVRISGSDFGPGPNASEAERKTSVAQWRYWWGRQGGK